MPALGAPGQGSPAHSPHQEDAGRAGQTIGDLQQQLGEPLASLHRTEDAVHQLTQPDQVEGLQQAAVVSPARSVHRRGAELRLLVGRQRLQHEAHRSFPLVQIVDQHAQAIGGAVHQGPRRTPGTPLGIGLGG